MQYWLLPAILTGILIPALLICRQLRRRRIYAGQDFTRKLETLLKPRETVKVICPQKGGHCILTNSRILFEHKGDFSAFPLKDLKKLQGKNQQGNRTTVPKNMVSLTLTLDKEHTLRNTGEEFLLLTELLQKQQKKQKETAKKK